MLVFGMETAPGGGEEFRGPVGEVVAEGYQSLFAEVVAE